ncbi:hypothetical protein B0T24DRAFT_290905 [Lasiosphaeria ovina]|uniref:Uncharacterized protein n=1 Tax=Lasiosphaeria ovina TaxID=92902 RepID=A0AAE0KE56_9PEZI|nr:hypothetical protein B0T24DRAFT_290905 [Lasiosphaeria ovina]
MHPPPACGHTTPGCGVLSLALAAWKSAQARWSNRSLGPLTPANQAGSLTCSESLGLGPSLGFLPPRLVLPLRLSAMPLTGNNNHQNLFVNPHPSIPRPAAAEKAPLSRQYLHAPSSLYAARTSLGRFTIFTLRYIRHVRKPRIQRQNARQATRLSTARQQSKHSRQPSQSAQQGRPAAANPRRLPLLALLEQPLCCHLQHANVRRHNQHEQQRHRPAKAPVAFQDVGQQAQPALGHVHRLGLAPQVLVAHWHRQAQRRLWRPELVLVGRLGRQVW